MTYMDVGNAVKAGAIYCLSHGGEEGELNVRSTLQPRNAQQLCCKLGTPLSGGSTAMDGGSVDIEVGIARMCLSG